MECTESKLLCIFDISLAIDRILFHCEDASDNIILWYERYIYYDIIISMTKSPDSESVFGEKVTYTL